MIGHVFFVLLVLFLFYPIIYLFKSDKNKLEKNLNDYEKKNGKTNL